MCVFTCFYNRKDCPLGRLLGSWRCQRPEQTKLAVFAERQLLLPTNGTKTQQSTVELTVGVAVLMGEGVGGIGATARWLNWLCGFRVRRSAGGGRKPHGEGGDWDGGRFFFLRALYTEEPRDTKKRRLPTKDTEKKLY